jgi:hypothetical protein
MHRTVLAALWLGEELAPCCSQPELGVAFYGFLIPKERVARAERSDLPRLRTPFSPFIPVFCYSPPDQNEEV